MDAVRVAALREILSTSGWVDSTRAFGGELRRASVRGETGGLLLVGTPDYEPWHLAAHLDDEAAWCGVPELSPVLVRHAVAAGAPPHLAVGLKRLARARRGSTLLVASPQPPGPGLLERVTDARRAGATVLALSAGDDMLRSVAHEALAVDGDQMSFDILQHLVSAAAGETPPPARPGRGGFHALLSRLVDQLTTPPPTDW